jgi:hypothetical protein
LHSEQHLLAIRREVGSWSAVSDAFELPRVHDRLREDLFRGAIGRRQNEDPGNLAAIGFGPGDEKTSRTGIYTIKTDGTGMRKLRTFSDLPLEKGGPTLTGLCGPERRFCPHLGASPVNRQRGQFGSEWPKNGP